MVLVQDTEPFIYHLIAAALNCDLYVLRLALSHKALACLLGWLWRRSYLRLPQHIGPHDVQVDVDVLQKGLGDSFVFGFCDQLEFVHFWGFQFAGSEGGLIFVEAVRVVRLTPSLPNLLMLLRAYL